MSFRLPLVSGCVSLALLLSSVSACAPTSPPAASALWSRRIVGGVENARLDDGVLLFEANGPAPDGDQTDAFDVQSGRRLWERAGAAPILGAPGFLAIGNSVDRIDVHSGRSLWSAMPRCAKGGNGSSTEPSYVALITGMAYIGCRAGEILAVQSSNGRVLAAAHPIRVDSYAQIVPLGHDALGVGGIAGGAYLHHQSAIVSQRSLSLISAFGPDLRILGMHHGDAVIEDACCEGRHSDSSPSTIDLISLKSGETVSSAILHPYLQPLPRDRDQPLSGMSFQVGDALYVPTHTALFAYDLGHLNEQPRTLYNDLANVPMLTDARYLTIEEGTPGDVRSSTILDVRTNMRPIWTEKGNPLQIPQQTVTRTQLILRDGRAFSLTVDRGCMLNAQSASYAFMVCVAPTVPSNAHLGTPAPIASGPSAPIPETIAVYRLPSH